MATNTNMDVEVHNTLSLAVKHAYATAMLLASSALIETTTKDAFEGIVTLLEPAVDVLREGESATATPFIDPRFQEAQS